jgi:transcriptional regulator with XRE-family HTH domain
MPNILGKILYFLENASYIGFVLNLTSLGEQIATRRKALGLSQTALAQKAGVGRSTLEALENARLGELGYAKITNILAAMGLELRLQETGSHRSTLEDLLDEDRDDQGMDRRR